MAYHSNFVAQNHFVAQLDFVAQWWMVQEGKSVNHVAPTGTTDSVPPASSHKLKNPYFFSALFCTHFYIFSMWFGPVLGQLYHVVNSKVTSSQMVVEPQFYFGEPQITVEL